MTASVDWRGVAITPGATVVYPGRVGSTVYMVEAVVIDAPENGPLVVERMRENHYGRTVSAGGKRASLPVARHVTVLHVLPPLPTGDSTTTTEPEEAP